MKATFQFAVFVATALFGFAVHGSDGVPPKYQPRPATAPQDEQSYPYAPAQSVPQRDQPGSTGEDPSHDRDDCALPLADARATIRKVKDKLSAGQAASPSQRAECLRLAAVLAELAGLDNDAKHLRDEAEKDRPPLSVMEVLAHKQAQLDALQSQVAALRRLTHTEQQVRLDVRFVEISRTKMREAGIKLPALNKTGDHATIGVIDSDHELFAVLEDLRAKGIARVLAEPSLLTVSGRPAFFHSGGEFPFLRQMPQETTIEFKSFGTQIDFVPIVVGDGKLHLDVKPRISSVDPTLSVDVGGLKVPGLNVRECDTGIEMASGQSAVVAGIVQNRVESRPNKGSGATVETIEETELLVLARATLVKDSDAAQAVSAAYRSGHYSPVDHPTQATKTK